MTHTIPKRGEIWINKLKKPFVADVQIEDVRYKNNELNVYYKYADSTYSFTYEAEITQFLRYYRFSEKHMNLKIIEDIIK